MTRAVCRFAAEAAKLPKFMLTNPSVCACGAGARVAAGGTGRGFWLETGISSGAGSLATGILQPFSESLRQPETGDAMAASSCVCDT